MAQERVQRRLAAILAADVVGYSRMMERDEAGTLSRLKAHRRELIDPAVKAHDGRIVKSTGDGILVEFPSAVEAVSCAVEVQRAMLDRNAEVAEDKRIVFRIGINLGDLIIEADDIYGEGVNLAARLEGLSPPGGLAISRAVRDQIRDKLPLSLEDQGERQVKNIARPVRVYALSPAAIANLPAISVQVPPTPPTSKSVPFIAAALAAVLMLTASLAAWWLWRSEPKSTGPAPTVAVANTAPAQVANTAPTPSTASAQAQSTPRLSIVVLPFQNLSNDPEQEYFADGITEDLTTDLSRHSGMFVISRNTAFTYKGKPLDVKQVGRELGVRYVLEGSARRFGDDVRINAQLIDAETGGHLWAQRFDGQRAQLAALNDDIVGRVGQALLHEMTAAEGRRTERKAPHELDAEDLAMRGWSIYLRGKTTRESLNQALGYFEQAVRLDPRSVRGWRGLSFVHALLVVRNAIDPETARRVVDEAARRTQEIAPTDYFTLYAQQHKRYLESDWPGWLRGAEEIISRFPSDAEAHGDKGTALNFLGRPEESFAPLETAIRLSPQDPRIGTWYYQHGLASSQMGQHEKAVSWFRRALETNPDFVPARVWLPASLTLVGGHEAEAKAAFAELMKRQPGVTASRLHANAPRNPHPRYSEARESAFAALRGLGLPD